MSPRPILRMLPAQFVALQDALLASAPLESVAVGFAGWFRADGHTVLTWHGFELAGSRDYERREAAGAVVRPEFLARHVKRVRQTGEALILCHTHPFSSVPGFSGIDDGGEDVLIPKVLARADAPHGGLVVGQDGASARIWVGRDGPTSADLVIPGRPERGGEDDGFKRQDQALGPGTAAALSKTSVGVVGTGGLGWDIATLLWMHGVGRIVLVDPDTIEDHNRPRLRGVPLAARGAKVDVLAALLRASRANGEVVAIPHRFEEGRARRAVADVELILCATDSLTSRLNVDRFARRLQIPLIDAGINIQTEGGQLSRVGARVCILWPDGPCLLCMGVFGPDDVAAEADPIGYRGQGTREEAAVAAFNAVVAGVAVSESLKALLAIGTEPGRSRYLVYDGLAQRLREIAVPPAGTCGTCEGLAGSLDGTLP